MEEVGKRGATDGGTKLKDQEERKERGRGLKGQRWRNVM